MTQRRTLLLLAALALLAPAVRATTTSAISRRRPSRRPWPRSPPAWCRSRRRAASTWCARAGGAMIRHGLGPTSGLIVGADGYIISSAFNFANKPTTIDVSVPGQKQRYPAKVIATDQTRMLTLLKIEGDRPARPDAGAQGRHQDRPDRLGRRPHPARRHRRTAVGGRRHRQRDSAASGARPCRPTPSISPANYGGPLIDLRGRVVRASSCRRRPTPRARRPASRCTTPASASPSRWKTSTPSCLASRRGPTSSAASSASTSRRRTRTRRRPVVSSVEPGSAAEKAGVQPGDRIAEIDGKPVETQVQLQMRLGSKYEGDVDRGQDRARRQGDRPARP